MADPVDPQPPASAEQRPPESGVLTPTVPPTRRSGHTYSGRFRAAYIALTVLFWVTVAGGTLLVTRGTGGEAKAWSAWKPTTTNFEGARQIASHVASRYRLDDGTQLVAVQAHEPEIQNVPLAAVALRGGGDVTVLPAKHSVVYILCGLGQRCSISSGKATVARARLLRREALELALYTLKYVKGVDSVIAFLPPPPKSDTNWSLYFRKGDVKDQLSAPLRQTLPAARSLTPGDRIEADTVERLTRPRWFRSQFQQLQDGDAILVLDPLAASS